MNKLGFLLLAAISATSAFAGEVDAQNPKIANSTPAIMAVAIADTGVSTSWTSAPMSKKASADRIAQLQDLNEKISSQVSEDLEQRIFEKMELSFTH